MFYEEDGSVQQFQPKNYVLYYIDNLKMLTFKALNKIFILS